MRGLAIAVTVSGLLGLLGNLGLAGCAARTGVATPLPEPPPRALGAIAPQLDAGEQTAWDVYLHDVPIGRARLAVDGRTARTTFRTNKLAGALASIRYEHASSFGPGGLRGAREQLVMDGKRESAEIAIAGAAFTAAGVEHRVPGGTRLHDVHSALGVVRAWSREGAPTPGYLWLWVHGDLYRLDVGKPSRDDVLGLAALRIDGTVRAPDLPSPIPLTLWLARGPDRTLLKLAIRADGQRITADVVESTATLRAR